MSLLILVYSFSLRFEFIKGRNSLKLLTIFFFPGYINLGSVIILIEKLRSFNVLKIHYSKLLMIIVKITIISYFYVSTIINY